MANKKVILVNESSLVDLKAELYRKETQFKRVNTVNTSQPKKAPIWQKQKKQKKRDQRLVKITSSDNSFDKELEKSRTMLEAKSALYDKLSSGDIEVPSDEDEQEGRFLVDFHQKTLPKMKDEPFIDGSLGQEIPPVNSDDEWVEYEDCFGRSKKCLRKDLPQMKDIDEKSKLKLLEQKQLPTLLSNDMRREMMRKKWEQEVQDALDKPVGPIHYQDLLFDETRDHGVGYYKFSKVEDERQEQQATLNKLRTQTEQQRRKRENILLKRKAAMDSRLAKIRERKAQKLGGQGIIENIEGSDEKPSGTSENIPCSNDEHVAKDDDEESTKDGETMVDGADAMMIGAMVERIRNKSAKIEKSHLNEWEKGKVDLSWFDKEKAKATSYDPRSERNPEFAPPSSYENVTGERNLARKRRSEKKERQTDDTGSDKFGNGETLATEKAPAPNSLDSTKVTGTDSRATASSSSGIEPSLLANSKEYSEQFTNEGWHHETSFNPYYPPIPQNGLPYLPPPPVHAFPPPLFPRVPPPCFATFGQSHVSLPYPVNNAYSAPPCNQQDLSAPPYCTRYPSPSDAASTETQ